MRYRFTGQINDDRHMMTKNWVKMKNLGSQHPSVLLTMVSFNTSLFKSTLFMSNIYSSVQTHSTVTKWCTHSRLLVWSKVLNGLIKPWKHNCHHPRQKRTFQLPGLVFIKMNVAVLLFCELITNVPEDSVKWLPEFRLIGV